MTIAFSLSDEQRLLADTLRRLLADRATSEQVRKVMATPEGVDEDLWRELAGMGVTGLLVAESDGGSGSTFVEASLVMEELGRTLAPVPYLSSAVLAVTAIQQAASQAQREQLLPDLAAGRRRATLVHLPADGRTDTPPDIEARADGDGFVLSGEAGYVLDGLTADLLVVAARLDGNLALFIVPADAAERTPVPVLDQTRPMARIRVSTGVTADARLDGDASAALAHTLRVGAVALACEQVGGATRALADATEYARTRVQFGRAIGSFQAIKHKLADLLVEVESARSAATYAARVVASGDAEELAVAAPVAASLCAEVYEHVAMEHLQVHGGIGFTWEHDAHLHLKRAKSGKLLLGDPHAHRRRLAATLGL